MNTVRNVFAIRVKRMILYFQDIGISEDGLSYVLGRWLFQWRMIEDSM